MTDYRLILASGSPRRRQLLQQAGYVFEVVVPSANAESRSCSGTAPAEMVSQLAVRKAADVAGQLAVRNNAGDALILAADTIAECEGQVLGKPASEDDARRMLTLLNGRPHRVLTGVCLWPARFATDIPIGPSEKPRVEVASTILKMDRRGDQQLQQYLDSGQWEGKAGAFGYQDRLGWVHIVEGSASNVVGLPMELVTTMLAEVESQRG